MKADDPEKDLETELMVRLKRNDEAALLALHERLKRNVYALALEMLRSPEDAEEVLQDTFVKLYEHSSRFDPARGSARAYVYTVARNEARLRLRARRSRPVKATVSDSSHAHSRLAAPAADHATRLTVEKALATLEEGDCELLRASFYRGFSHAELSAQTGLPLGTLKSRIRRALLKLRDLLEEA